MVVAYSNKFDLFQNEKKLKLLMQQRDDVQKKFEEQKIDLWELEGHIKKVQQPDWNVHGNL